uniref:F-box domain-containing protein n=1 Tax=Naja naja TaxID=35670 RepID=A0A8C6XRQ9_NAJNA
MGQVHTLLKGRNAVFSVNELLLGIFSYLNLADLLKISKVCQRWHRLKWLELLWQSLDLVAI